MKQIGAAVHDYEATRGHFPHFVGSLIPRGSTSGSASFSSITSPFVVTLGSLDLTVAFNAVNLSVPLARGGGLAENHTVMVTTIGTFLCPSDPPAPVEGYGRTNYRFCHGSSPYVIAAGDSSSPRESTGVFTADLTRNVTAADVRDGLSMTVGASERLGGGWDRGEFKPGGDYRMAPYDARASFDADAMVRRCESAPIPGGWVDSQGGETWFIGGNHTTSYNHVATPNRSAATCGIDPGTTRVEGRSAQPGSFPPTSRHPGGVNVLLMDGSVRFVRDAIGRPIWRGLATMGGGEPASIE